VDLDRRTLADAREPMQIIATKGSASSSARPMRPFFGSLLKVIDKGDYNWVECGSCDAGWQVPHYAPESLG
jgi:hypothetical protein